MKHSSTDQQILLIRCKMQQITIKHDLAFVTINSRRRLMSDVANGVRMALTKKENANQMEIGAPFVTSNISLRVIL